MTNRSVLIRSRLTGFEEESLEEKLQQCSGALGPSYDPVPERCSLEENHDGRCE